MNIVFLGPPNSGKGTYAKRIAEKLGLPYVGSGDMFRNAYEQKTELGIKAHKYWGNGLPVPDELTIGVLKEQIKKLKNENGFVLDTPYTANQAKTLDEDPETKSDIAVNISVPENVLIERGSSRVNCPGCGAIYNLRDHNLRPKEENTCDKCGAELTRREDDKPEKIKTRLDAYKERSKPMENYYRELGKLREIRWDKGMIPEGEVDIPIELMLQKILRLLE